MANPFSKNPLVSVIIPAHNSGKYIGETIDSVLKQTYQNFEIIVVDDNSTDNTSEIISLLMKEDKRINYFRIPAAGRPSVPRNIGVSKAKGEFIAFLDSDDIWVKHKLDDQVNFFKRNPGAVLVYSMSVTFGDADMFSPYFEVLPLLGRASKNYDDLINRGNSITCSSVLLVADVFKNIGGFDEDPLLQIEDYDLWIRISKQGVIGFIPRILVYYRIHSSQFSSSWETKKQRLEYLSKKRGIALPEYKFIRNRNIYLLIMRNTLHLATYIYVKSMEFIERNVIQREIY